MLNVWISKTNCQNVKQTQFFKENILKEHESTQRIEFKIKAKQINSHRISKKINL